MGVGAQVSETYPFSNADLELAEYDEYDEYDGHAGYDGEYGSAEDAPAEAVAPAGPIFVDASGRRRKLARRASLAAVAVVAGYAGLLAVSFAGGPIPPKALLPVPGMPAGKDPAPASSAAQNGAPAAGKTGGTDHPTTHPGGTASEHRTEPRPAAPATSGKAGPTSPQPTSTGSAALPPTPTSTPTGTSAASTTTAHGNPTPPGHTRKPTASGPTG